MSKLEQLATDENKYRQHMREAVSMLQEQLTRTDLTTEEQQQLRSRLQSLRSKLQDLKLQPTSEITLERIVHLREIFTHYCTHIFRVGKHMTFERLEYEKVHMTLDRFFVFLRDFQLTTMEVQGRMKQLVPKVKVINIFKKVSSNAKDITFEEFIECLERLAVVHYDESHFVADNKRPRSKAIPKKSLRKEKESVVEKPKDDLPASPSLPTEPKEDVVDIQNGEQKAANVEQLQPEDQPLIEQEQQQADPIKSDQDEQVDPIVQPTLKRKDKNSFDPADIDPSASQFEQVEKSIIKPSDKVSSDNSMPFNIPKNEKIEAFYRLVGVDSVRDYRKKLGELNLPMFKSAHAKKASSIQLSQPILEEPSEQPTGNDQSLRMQQIKQRIEQQKVLDTIKRKSPKKPPVDEQNDYQRMQELRREKRQREKQRIQRAKRAKKDIEEELARKLLQLPPPPPSKRLLNGPSYKATNVTWDDLERLNFEQVVRKDGQFHPHLLYDLDADDEQYMGDLKFDPNAVQKHRMLVRHASKKDVLPSEPSRVVTSQLSQLAEIREKKTSSLVDSTKKRAGELALQQKRRQAATDRLVRPKNRSSRQQL